MSDVSDIPKRFTFMDHSPDGPQRGVHSVEVHMRRPRVVATWTWPDGVMTSQKRSLRAWRRWFATLDIQTCEPFPFDKPDDQVRCRDKAAAIARELRESHIATADPAAPRSTP